MDKKSKIIIYVVIVVILLLLISIAVITKFSSSVPGITAYAEGNVTADAIINGYTWNSFLKSTCEESKNVMELQYDNNNTILVKPGEKITLRNSGKDFDTYKFYQEYITFYDKNGNNTSVTEEDAPVKTESKLISFKAPQEDGTYIFDIKVNYHNYGSANYGIKIVVSSLPSYSVENLVKYKNTYIGDASKVNQVLNVLPYKEYRDGLVLRTANKPYELITYYKGLEVEKEALLNNTVAIFALIDNVDIVTYELDSKSIVFTRKELETILGRDMMEYANNPELWKKELFYNVKETTNKDNLVIYKSLFNSLFSKINSNYIVVDLDSFGKIKISDVEKRELLKSLMNDDKIILEASNAEIRQRDSFKGILIYAEQVTETNDGFDITIVKYDTEKKQQTVKCSVSKDGTIIE